MSSVRSNFADRHIGPDEHQLNFMLAELGEKKLEDFIAKVVPENIALTEKLSSFLPKAVSEVEAINELRQLADQNQVVKSLIGLGYFGTITPPVILRNVLENPAWYTAYTPYQPEISQGRLEAIFAFQTVVTDLTGLDVSNASMLDEATAAAESMTLARRVWQGDDEAVFVVDAGLHPQVKAVIATRAKPLNISIVEIDMAADFLAGIERPIFGAILAQIHSNGTVENLEPLIKAVHGKSALAVVACDLLALTLYKAPGEIGADIAIGSAQRFGVPMGFGGPHAGFMAVRKGLERSLPGRLVGQSLDSHGNPALRLALQTREQHIRRDKATSNICTAQVLLAVMSAFYAMWHGPKGLLEIATRVRNYANLMRESVIAAGYAVTPGEIFDTFTISGVDSKQVVSALLKSGFNARFVNAETIGLTFDETITEADLLVIAGALQVKLSDHKTFPIEGDLSRSSQFLLHPLFNSYHSETSMLRYLRSLADRDLALDRTMIPLGSCTMKLNATTEMIPVTWPEFSSLHPFAPANQSTGIRKLISQLSDWLITITGYDAVSLQPNAGSQGEFAGLLAIRNYLDSKSQQHRTICLIPSSAHGTNAASAVMAGMQVVVIACDEHGNVSVADLKEKISEYHDSLAALMVTYPSTHGVFEEAITEICGLIHDAGGQVYVDGANLNALVGLAKPGKFGADVSHLNLHKTFCIPHGGGGPGVGPVIAKSHLAPFLPNHPLDQLSGPSTGPGPVSSAPFGSASILPISWAYIRMMGGAGLTKATEVAILSANYIAAKLDPHFPILYRGANGYIAHECIIDLREITKNTGVTVDDVAKRLMDHGFHAPTVSFPVAGTMMIEPTESEDLNEMERFISAMIQIRAEITDIEKGQISIEKSPLRFAPHTSSDLMQNDWDRKYSRKIGAFPSGEDLDLGSRGKYWPTVGRIDGVYGDRNLVCSCLPISELAIN
ncbi:MAG: aminomethyl-transferring glycine dehydrogenase [Actinobacteria bacterium]|nr:aminomethyl-transferring glycine dehydrogenase [Actinomycetota bacterium]